jgi:Tol biopolymer transport system component
VALIPAKGGGSIEIAGGGSFNTSPVWLPNGRSILFISDREGGRDVYRLALDGRGRPTGEPERLTTGLNAGSVSLSGDGRRLAYAAFVQTANVYALPSSDRGVMTEDQARAVTSGNQLMERVLVSPDGRWLAFDTNRNGNQDIYRVPVEGGEPEQVTGDRADEFVNAWSPDGSEIIYHTFRSGNRDIYVIPATGGEPRPLVVSPAQDRDGSLTPDGRRLGFASDRTGRFEVYLQTREGDGWGKPIRLTDDGGIFPTVSRDGRSIVFAHGKRVALIPTEGGKTEDLVFSGPLAGREEEVLVFDLGQDGRSGLAAFPADSTGVNEVWSVPFDGGTPRRVARFAGRGLGFGRGGLSESGGTLYLLLARSESDLWTVELGGR